MFCVSFLFASVVIDIVFLSFVCSVVVSLRLVWTALFCCAFAASVLSLFSCEFPSVPASELFVCSIVVCCVVHGILSSIV